MRAASWLLWLLIALMPVRGIAQSLMTGGAFGHGAAATTSAADAAPCPMHGAPATDHGAMADPSVPSMPGGTDDQHGTCSLCNVCHSAVLPLAAAPVRGDTLHDAAPLPALGLGAGRAAPSELFRPPR